MVSLAAAAAAAAAAAELADWAAEKGSQELRRHN